MSDDVQDLATRLARLEDREEIRALILAYRRALDGKDFRGYSELFASDGVFVAGTMEATGPAEILALVEGMVPEYLTEHPGDDLHLVGNIDIDVTGPDDATATSMWVYIVRGEGDVPELAKVGHYEDALRREDGRWRFARRSAPTDIPVA